MSPAWVALALAAARLWACLRVQASWRRAFGLHWEWLAAALAIVLSSFALLSGHLSPPALHSWTQLIVPLGFELMLGSVIGLLVSLPGHALVGAANESEQLMREGPGANPAPGSLSLALVFASLAAGLALGLHRPLLASSLASFDHFALGEAPLWLDANAGLEHSIVLLSARATALALALATPLLLSHFLASTCLACLGRGGPELDSLRRVLGPGLRLGFALLALGAAWSAYPEAFARGM